MKHIIVTRFSDVANRRSPRTSETEMVFSGDNRMDASDGYHTFTELYEHRIALFITLVRGMCRFKERFPKAEAITQDISVWRSKFHSDGSSFEGWFILGINKEKGKQITYHLPISRWNDTEFAETLELAPEWDGHTPADVLNRLKDL